MAKTIQALLDRRTELKSAAATLIEGSDRLTVEQDVKFKEIAAEIDEINSTIAAAALKSETLPDGQQRPTAVDFRNGMNEAIERVNAALNPSKEGAIAATDPADFGWGSVCAEVNAQFGFAQSGPPAG